MNDAELLSLSRGLANIARRQKTEDAEKVASLAENLSAVASSPYAQNALIGAAAGGAVGLLQRKNKLRALRDYALMGGLGGLGLTAFNRFSSPATPPPAVANAGYDNNIGGAILGTTLNAGGAAAGGYGGHKLHGLVDSHGKLDRLLDSDAGLAKKVGPAVDRMRTAGKSQAEIIEALGARKGTGRAFTSALNKLPKVRGRYALPLVGALAVPTLINSLRGGAASE